MNFSSILFFSGILLSFLAGAMYVAFFFELSINGFRAFEDFLIPLLITTFSGFALIIGNKSRSNLKINHKDAFLITAISWCILTFFASLPFYFSNSLNLSFLDCWFESVSTLTTTGFSMIENANSNLLLPWRLTLVYIGGAGMILMGMIIFPTLRLGGLNLFRTESSEKSEKLMPKISQFTSLIFTVYTIAIFLFFFLLMINGFSAFDALCHSMTSVATCGISSFNNSLKTINNFGAELTILFAMIFGGTPFFYYIKIIRTKKHLMPGTIKNKIDKQMKTYFFTIIYLSIFISAWLWSNKYGTFFESVRYGVFNTVSFMTTTGFSNCDYNSLGNFTRMFFLFTSLIGGCTGSSSGGIKIFRFEIIFLAIKKHLKQLASPKEVIIAIYDDNVTDEKTIISVMIFFLLYLFSLIIIILLLAMNGFNFFSAFSTGIGALTNSGISPSAFGEVFNFNNIGTFAKIIIMFGMILGRLELLTFFVLFSKTFWKS